MLKKLFIICAPLYLLSCYTAPAPRKAPPVVLPAILLIGEKGPNAIVFQGKSSAQKSSVYKKWLPPAKMKIQDQMAKGRSIFLWGRGQEDLAYERAAFVRERLIKAGIPGPRLRIGTSRDPGNCRCVTIVAR